MSSKADIRDTLERIKADLRALEWLLDRKEEKQNGGRLLCDPSRALVVWDGKIIPLSRSQICIVEYLARRPGIVRTRSELISVLDYGSEEKALEHHIGKIRRAFRRADPGFDELQTVYGTGYRWGI